MAIYQVQLNGSNFWFTVDGKPSRMGFYINRFVHAESPEQAEQAAIQVLRGDSRLQGLHNDPGDPPMIHIKELFELDPQPEELPREQGFVFYPEEPDA